MAENTQYLSEMISKIKLILTLIIPFVMFLVGNMLKRHPISDMRSQNGYNTPLSRKSQAHWDYAQNIAPDIFILFGVRLFLIEGIWIVISVCFNMKVEISIISGITVGIIFLILAFLKTEKCIKEKFEKLDY